MLFISDKAVLKNGDVVIRTDNFTQTSFTNTGTKTAKILASQDGVTYKQILSLASKASKEVTDNYAFYKLQGDTEVYVYSNTPQISVPNDELSSILDRLNQLESADKTSMTVVTKPISQYELINTDKFIEIEGHYLPLYDLQKVVFYPKESSLKYTFMQNEQASINLSDLVTPIKNKKLDNSLWETTKFTIRNGYLVVDTVQKTTSYVTLSHPDIFGSISIDVTVTEPFSIQDFLDNIRVEITPKDDGSNLLQMIADVQLPRGIYFSNFTITHDGTPYITMAFGTSTNNSPIEPYSEGEYAPTYPICEDTYYSSLHNPFQSITVTHNGKSYSRTF